MALINPIHGDMSGSIGDNVFSHNRGGRYVRTQQAEWQSWASLNPVVNRLGLSQIVSGINAYVMLNARLVQSGDPIITNPPVSTGPAQFTGLAITPTVAATLSVAFTGTPDAGVKMLLWQTLPGTAGRNDNFNQARLVGYSAEAITTPVAFTTPYSFASGNAFNCYVQAMDEFGQVSPPQKVRVLVP